MASLSAVFRSLNSVASALFRGSNHISPLVQQVRTKFVKKHQMKDHKRRLTVKKLGGERLLTNTIYRCKLLPPELRDVAHKEVIALPRDSNYIRIRDRCYATSRPRGCIYHFRVSRIVFRHLADYNKLSGVQRAMW